MSSNQIENDEDGLEKVIEQLLIELDKANEEIEKLKRERDYYKGIVDNRINSKSKRGWI